MGETTDRALEFRVLGPIEARADGRALDVGGRRQRRLLALLLVAPGELRDSATLTEYVWDDHDRPASAADTIRTYVSRLRRVVAESGLDGSAVIATQSPGYRVDLTEAALDSRSFETLVERAGQVFANGNAAATVSTLDEALDLWSGTPFQEFADLEWAQPEVARLEELRRVALEQRAAARMDMGAHAEVVGDLERLLEEDHLRARPAELLMLAFYRSNRQADALRVASNARRALADVGLDLPDSIADLETRILRDDAELRPVLASADTIRGYRLGEKLGEGAFSVVYRSVQPSLGREVAVKQIRSELADQPDFIRSFEAEAQTVAGLEHPHIVPLYDYWREPGAAYLVMRWLRGGTLENRLRQRRLDAVESVALATQIGSALATAHHAGVAHRDVRSANVFEDEQGNHYLGDFGIATEDEAGPGRWQADVRGLGELLFEAVTGKSVNGVGAIGASPGDVVGTVHQMRPDLPVDVEGVLLRATVGAGAERYTTVEEFVDDYVAALNGSASTAGASAPVPLVEDVVNPYKGLRAYQESDAADFRGRDRLIERLVHQVAESHLVGVVGPSGSGKSSLVRAGLLPRVRQGAIAGSDSWFVTTMTPGVHPFEELEAALHRVAVSPTAGLVEVMRRDHRGISRAVRVVLPEEAGEVLVVVDQFEELFTLVADEEERTAFIEGLVSAATDPMSHLRVVLTIRADHWHRPLQYPALASVLELSNLTVTPMSGDELERAIVDPARRMGVSFEPGLAAEIATEVHGQPGALPLMQYVLTELFEERQSGMMAFDAYHPLGGVTGGLSRRADELLQGSTAEEQAAIRRLFSRLVTPGEGVPDTRRRVRLSELASVPAGVVERFGAAGMLSFDHDPVTREPTVEVAHEALIREWPRLRGWVDSDRDGLRIHRRLGADAAEWEGKGRPDSELYRGGRLEAVEAWAGDHTSELNDPESRFVTASVTARQDAEAEERRRMQRLRILSWTAVLIAIFALVAGGLAWNAQRDADRHAAESERVAVIAEESASEAERLTTQAEQSASEAERAAIEAERLAESEQAARMDAVISERVAQAAALAEQRPTVAMLIAREAYDRAPGPDTLGALFAALGRTDGFLGRIPRENPSVNDDWLGLVDDETIVVRGLESIDLYDVSTRSLIRSHAQQAVPVGFYTVGSVGGGRFTTVTVDGDIVTIPPDSTDLVAVDDPQRTLEALPQSQSQTDETAYVVSTGADASAVVGYWSGHVVHFTGPDLGVRRVIGQHPHPVVATAVSDDGKWIASNDTRGNITLWDVQTTEPRWTWTLAAGDDAVEEAGVIHGAVSEAGTVLDMQLVPGGPRPVELDEQNCCPFIFGELDFGNDGTTLYSIASGPHAIELESGFVEWRAPIDATVKQMQELDDGSLIYGTTRLVDGVAHDLGVGVDAGLPRVVATPDGSTVVAMAAEGELELWSTAGHGLINTRVDRGELNAATTNRDGSVLAAFVEPNLSSTVLLDVAAPAPTGDREVEGLGSWRSFTATGDLFGYGIDRVIELRDPESGELLGPTLPPQRWGSVELDPDRTMVAVGEIHAPRVRIYDVATAEPVDELNMWAGEGGVYWLEFSPDGSLLAASTQTATIIWDTATWERVETVPAISEAASPFSTFSPDGSVLAVLDTAGTVALYDLEKREMDVIATGVASPNGTYHENNIEFTDDGRHLVFGGNTVSMIDVASGELVGPIIHSSGIGSATVADGGRAVVSGDEESIFVWRLEPETWPDLACQAAGRNMTEAEWERYGWPDEPYHATCPQWPGLDT